MKGLLKKLSSDLERVGEVFASKNVHALYKFAEEPAVANQIIKSFSLDNDTELQFDSGKHIISSGVADYVDGKIKSEIEALGLDRQKYVWEFDIKIRGNASKVPYAGSGGNIGLANRRAAALKPIIEKMVSESELINSVVSRVTVEQGTVTGIAWNPSLGKDHSDYRKEQYVTVSFVTTGNLVEVDHGKEPQARASSWCINLGGKQYEVECEIKGEIARCSSSQAPGFKSNADFGWFSEGPCPRSQDIINVPQPWLHFFYICQDRCSGMLLKNEKEIPYVGVDGGDEIRESLKASGMWLEGSFITKEELAKKCSEQDDSIVLKVIEWPKREDCDKDLPKVASSKYCEDEVEKAKIERMLPIRSGVGGSSNPGVVDIIYDYLSDGWSGKVRLAVRTTSSAGGTYELNTGVRDASRAYRPFSKRKSRSLSRQAWEALGLDSVNFARRGNEDKIKDMIEGWINDGNKLDAQVKNIPIQRYFQISNRSTLTKCSGWDFIRWGGPCDTWGADARYEEDFAGMNLKGKYSGPNQGTSPDNPRAKPYLPEPNDNAKHIRVLQWFMGWGGMTDELAELKRSEDLHVLRRGEVNPANEQNQGDTAQKDSDPYQYGVGDSDPRYDATNDVLDDMLESRGFRRNFLRRINKSSSYDKKK